MIMLWWKKQPIKRSKCISNKCIISKFWALNTDIYYISIDLMGLMMCQSPGGWRLSGSGERREN